MENKLKTFLIKLSIVLAIITAIIIVIEYYHLNEYLSIAGFNEYKDDVLEYKLKSPISFVIQYVLLYILLIAICIPGTIILDLFAGFIFGYFSGSILVIFSYSMGAIVNFYLVHYLFKGLLKNKFTKFKVLVHGNNENELLRNLIGLRLIPVIPFWMLNILASLLNVRIRVFVLSTVIGIIPTSIIYAIIGDGLRDATNQVKSIDIEKILFAPKVWIPLLVLAILVLMPNIIKYVKAKHKKK